MEYDGGDIVFESLWRTRQNDLVPLQDMEDTHLLNTLDYLRSVEFDDVMGETILPFARLPRTAHNIGVIEEEIERRQG